jgi:hypothetical protein
MAAPSMSQADYQDIQQLLNAGQLREGYTGQQTQADINKFNFLQNQPQQNLSNYLSMVYGNPMGRVTNQQTSGPSGFQNLLGLAAVGGGLYKNLGSPDMSWLNPWGGAAGGFNQAANYASTSPTGWLDF